MNDGGSPEPASEPFQYGSIPPYEYPVSPIVDVVPEQPKRQPELVQPFQRPHKPFITQVSPVAPVSPEKHIVPEPANAPDNVAVRMAHPETVTLPPVQEVVRQPESLTPVKEKEVTPVKQKPDEKMNGNLTNQPQNVNFPVKKSDNFSPAPTAKKLPKKMQFKGKKGRQRTEAEVRDLLTFVQNRNGAWPNDNYVSEQMRRYYRREYPEYFRKVRKGKAVHTARSAPIDLSTRRTGTGV